MAKNKNIFKEQARIPLNLNIEKDDFVKIEKQLSISCRFQSIQIWSKREKPFSNKKAQNQSIRGQITFGIQLQTSPSKCNTRKLHSIIWNTAKKILSINRGNQNKQYNEATEKL